MKILIVSYFFSPDKRVGALRTSYWYKELEKNYPCSIEVLTANTTSEGKGIHVIPKTGKFSRFSLIKDEGLLWRKNVIAYLNKHPIQHPDVVIISGSPFMHFSLSGFFRKKFNSKVILDYRDPFATNPGFSNSGLKIKIKQLIEKRFNRMADGIVTVNSFCAALIEGFNLKPNAIVQNGYDETVQPNLTAVDPSSPSFSYAGKFYFDPSHMIEVFARLKVPFAYVGPDSELLGNIDGTTIQSMGFVDYPSSVQHIANHDVGIIQTYGEDFQSTTKIFDYVRCQRMILVISNKYLEQGSIFEELKGYPNVFWAKNDKAAIESAIERIRNSEYIPPSKDFCQKFSRKAQMQHLIELIDRIK